MDFLSKFTPPGLGDLFGGDSKDEGEQQQTVAAGSSTARFKLLDSECPPVIVVGSFCALARKLREQLGALAGDEREGDGLWGIRRRGES